ncbi:MAG: DsbA family protein [Robiginitomaculum sp.]|nr:DsbA family protein [Robiginitomaculum sp.]
MKRFTKRTLLSIATTAMIIGLASCGGANTSNGRSAIERDDDHALGNPDAAVTIIEYASLTCPACAAFHQTIYPELKAKYIDTGKVRFIFRQFPTPPARLAVGGEALARCEGSTETYFELIDVLFEKQRLWRSSQNPGQALRDIGAAAGITTEQFDACLADKENVTRIQDVVNHAVATWGINSTPSFVINGEYVQNIRNIDDFAKVIDPVLANEENK